VRAKPINANRPKQNLPKLENAKNGVNETTKDNESKGKWRRTTRKGEHHVPVRT